MKVELVSISQGAGKLAGRSAQDVISYAARVSNPSNQANFDTASKLLAYCIKKAHWSIFEQSSMGVEITTSRAIAAQLLRHKSFSFQEASQRYMQVTNFELYLPRRQDKKNRQNSIDDMSQKDHEWFIQAQQKVAANSFGLYQEALDRGIAKEQARFLLPLSTTSTLYMHGTARSWIHYLQIRAASETQKEHREIAEAIRGIFAEQFPDIAKALEWA